MDLASMIAELRQELLQINRAILTLESLVLEHGTGRGRLPGWIDDHRPHASGRKRIRSVAKKAKKRK